MNPHQDSQLDHAPFEGTLIAQPEDKLPISKAALLGLQHILAMDVYVVPFIIASALALSVAESASLIQATFLTVGFATLVQSQWCMRLPVAQGPSYIPIGAVIAIALSSGGGMNGLNTVFGAILPGAILITLLGASKLFHRMIARLVPPLVGGTIILVVGIALMPIALRENIFAVHGVGTVGGNILLASLAGTILIGCLMAGIVLATHGIWLRLSAVLLALIGGCIAASFMGQFSWAAVIEADWLTPPRLAFIDFNFVFSPSAMLTMLVVYIALMAETTGTWFAVGAVINQKLPPEKLDRGAVGEGLGCILSAFFGSTPVTGYSTNAGIIAITGIASRMAFAAAGILFVLFGLMGKLSAAIASIPAPVIGGVFAVICTVIAMNGVRVIRHAALNERNMLVVGLPVLMALFVTLAPPEFVKTLPELAQYFFGSSVAVGAIAAMLLHQILPQQKAN